MPTRSSFFFIVSFITAILITGGLCIFTLFMIGWSGGIELSLNLFTFMGLMNLLILGTLILLSYFSVKNLAGLWQLNESAAKYYLFVLVLIDVVAGIWYFYVLIEYNRFLYPAILVNMLVLTGCLYHFYRLLPDTHSAAADDHYTPFAPASKETEEPEGPGHEKTAQ